MILSSSRLATSSIFRRASSTTATSLRCLSALPNWATLDPATLGSNPTPHAVQNLVNGSWSTSASTMDIPNPLDRNAPPVCTVPDTQGNELVPFVESLRSVPKSGVHNPLKNVERYLQFGEISRKVRRYVMMIYYMHMLCEYCA